MPLFFFCDSQNSEKLQVKNDVILFVREWWCKAGYQRNGVTYCLNDIKNLKTTGLLGQVVDLCLSFIWINFICGRNKSEKFDSKEGHTRFRLCKKCGAKRTTADLLPLFLRNNVNLLNCYITFGLLSSYASTFSECFNIDVILTIRNSFFCDTSLVIVSKALLSNNFMTNLDEEDHWYTKHHLLVENTHQIVR